MKRVLVAVLISSLCLGCGPRLLPTNVALKQGTTPAPMLATEQGRLPVVVNSNGRHKLIQWDIQLGSDGDVAPYGAMSLSSSIDLSTTKLEASSCQPGQEVIIDNVPTNMGKVRVAILNPDNSVKSWAMLRDISDSRRIAMMTPLMPGEIRLRVYCRSASGPILSLAIDSLPPAPSGQGARDLVTASARLVDYDPLAQSASSSVPLIVHLFLDCPANANSISALLAGTAPSLQGQQMADRKQIDALLASLGVVSGLRQMQGSLNRLASAQTAVTSASSGYRTQDFSSSFINLLSGQSASELDQLRQTEIDLENNQVDCQNALNGVIATLSSAITSSNDLDQLVFALAAIKIGSALKYLQAKAYLPAAVELDRPWVTGMMGYDAFTFSADQNLVDSRTKQWHVNGRIVSRPVTMSASSMLEMLGLNGNQLKELAIRFYLYINSGFTSADREKLRVTINNGTIEVVNSQVDAYNRAVDEWNNSWKGWILKLSYARHIPLEQLPAWVDQELAAIQNLNDILKKVVSPDNTVADLQYDQANNQLTWGSRKIWYEGDLTPFCTAKFSSIYAKSPVTPLTSNYYLVSGAGLVDMTVSSNVSDVAGQGSNFLRISCSAVMNAPASINVITGQPHRVTFKWFNIDTLNLIFDTITGTSVVPDCIVMTVDDGTPMLFDPEITSTTETEASGSHTVRFSAGARVDGRWIQGKTQATTTYRVTDWPSVSANTAVAGKVTLNWQDMDLLTKVNGLAPTRVLQVLDDGMTSATPISTQMAGAYTEALSPGHHTIGLATGYADPSLPGGWYLGPIQTTVSFDVAQAPGSLDLSIH